MAHGDTDVISLHGVKLQAQTGRAPFFCGIAFIVAALVLVGIRLYAFEALLRALAALFSSDGVVEAANRNALDIVLVAAAATAAVAGALLLALSTPAGRAAAAAVVAWDPLRARGFAVPRPGLVLASSAAIGTAIVGMHLVGSRLGGPLGPLFQKEGPFELVTVALALAGAAWCAVAAARWLRHAQPAMRAAAMLHGGLAAGLFFVGMEELNWGQTLLEFETPPSWAAINHQQQTSLHNLIEAPALERAERIFVAAFGLAVLALIALALRLPRSLFAALAPPAALVPLAALCAVPGFYLRLEVTELLLTLFFAFYAYRLYVAARAPAAASA